MRAKTVAHSILALPRSAKRAVALAVDVVLCALAVWIAFYLRLDQWVTFKGIEWLAVAISVALAVPIFVVSGLYRAIFRYSGAAALVSITQAAVVYGVMYASIVTLVQIEGIPRTVGIIQPVLLFLLVAASRVLAGWWLGGSYAQLISGADRKPVMIYGAGSAGRQLFKALATTDMRVVGFVDDDETLHGRVMMGVPVHKPSRLEELVRRNNLTDILLAVPSASRQRRNEILDLIRPLSVAVRTVPGLTDLAKGLIKTSDIRELDIEDLLGREPVAPDEELLRANIRGKTVLVTGAGGSIGSELCRQILREQPTVLLLVEMSEAALYSIHSELEILVEELGGCRLVPLLASVCDAKRMREIMHVWKPDTIYHAAAYKHVPLVEHNPAEGVRNNVFGTQTLAQIGLECGVSNFVFVSTDKAVRPTNVMGTTKRLAEQVLQAIAATSAKTCFSMVRFGNVLDSSGSVVPLFRRQIREGGPVTITDAEMTRYFMTIPEAAQLVIQAGAMASGGDVFVLDMGEPVKIVDLARRMIELSGLKVIEQPSGEGDIELSFVGLRPGEKLYEELLIGDNPKKTGHPRIMKANEHFITWDILESKLDELDRAVSQADVRSIARHLRELVPEYRPESGQADWVLLAREQNQASEMADRGDKNLSMVASLPVRRQTAKGA
jgi:FlaA1/EpsC-like NDP-sugar epimerase